MKNKVYHFDPPAEDSPTIEALRQVRVDVPYIVINYKRSGNSAVWERMDKGKVRCVHGGLKDKIGEENHLVSSAFAINADVLYCTKKEAFMVCL